MENLGTEKRNRKPQAAVCDIVIQELKDETLIYDLVAKKALCLNSTASFVWKKCDGNHSVADISRELACKTGQSASEDIVWLALNLLEKEKLITGSGATNLDFDEISRREIIKKAGLATMIALPTIAQLMAPTAASAASSASNTSNGACTSDCSTILGGVCACLGSVTCAPGTTLGATLGVGVCVNASVAVNAGISVSGGLNGNVCLFTNVCATI